jgi:hypothetical protein
LKEFEVETVEKVETVEISEVKESQKPLPDFFASVG